MAALRLDYEALGSSAKTLREQGDIFEECINKMTSVIDALPDIWEAETCDRYVEEYDESKKTLTDVRQLIEDMAAQMTQISENFSQADSDMANQMK
ncbi:WXG100 family type VII secretion target [Lachnobacterium bovis]|uniref:WXG100 family type VII secretion target n=1 Tax=Lachnobacterium bovis TaxID=140626 RepID=UPI0003B5EDD0|nr:WXG100 family type VII secretion target [Lachnobacterium bovis]